MTTGHNGGPPDGPLTPSMKLECIKSILDRSDLTAAQKCTGAGIIANADREWVAAVTTADLQRYSSAKDRETVFRATRVLDEKRIVAKASVRGQAGKYNVLPPHIVSSVIEAYNEMKSGRDKADHSDNPSGRVKPDGTSGRHPTTQPVGFDPTSPAKPVGSDPTSRLGPDQSRARARTRNESPSGIVISNKFKGEGKDTGEYEDTAPPPPDEVIVFQGQIVALTDADVAKYRLAYPELEYPASLKQADAQAAIARTGLPANPKQERSAFENALGRLYAEQRRLAAQLAKGGPAKASRRAEMDKIAEHSVRFNERGRIELLNGEKAEFIQKFGTEGELENALGEIVQHVNVELAGADLLQRVRGLLTKQLRFVNSDGSRARGGKLKETYAEQSARYDEICKNMEQETGSRK